MNVMDTRKTSAMLYLDGVHVSFDGFHAINDLSLALEPGEMRAIIGPNGAGKTTMMDIITGKTKPDEGVVLFDGVTDLTRLDETRIAELGIGRKFQKPTVFESQTVQDNLLLALNVDHSVKGTLFWRGSRDEVRADRQGAGNDPPHRSSPSSRRQPVAWPETVAGDRHAAGAGPEGAAGRRAGRGNDRCRDPSVVAQRTLERVARDILGVRTRRRVGRRRSYTPAESRALGSRADRGGSMCLLHSEPRPSERDEKPAYPGHFHLTRLI